MIRFRQLEAFRLVVSHGSMSAAADMMYVSQPAVSRLISDLESEVGFQLFDRRRGLSSPTAEGLRFFGHVEENFLGLSRLENAAEEIRQNSAKLRIAVTHSLAATVLPLALKRFHTRFPETKVVLRAHRLSQVILQVQSRTVDIALGSQIPPMPNLGRFYLGSTRQICVLRRDHPLAARSVISPVDLVGQSIVRIPPDGPADWSQLDMLMADIPHTANFEANTSQSIYALANEGLVVAIVEPFSFRLWAGQNLVARPFQPHIVTHFYVISSMQPAIAREIEWFHSCLRQQAASTDEFFQDPGELASPAGR